MVMETRVEAMLHHKLKGILFLRELLRFLQSLLATGGSQIKNCQEKQRSQARRDDNTTRAQNQGKSAAAEVNLVLVVR
jgi:hypothetical protein